MKRNFRYTMFAGVALGALIFSGVVSEDLLDGSGNTAYAASEKAGQGGQGGQGSAGGKGSGSGGQQSGKGGRSLLDDALSPQGEDEEDSDRPDWAGQSGRDGKPGNPNQTPGVSKGGLYGDLFAILRDDNGVPILYVWEDQDGDGVPDTAVQSDDGYPQPVDADGNLIPLNAEGEPVSDENVIEIEFSRLNLARSPTRVLSSRYLEAITLINQADELSLDSAGRLVITVDGESRTIDSPLENLAIYVELMNTGTLDGVTLDAETLGDLAFMVDGVFTVEDQEAAASFLAGAADKFGELTVDIVAYLNTKILSLEGTIEGPDGQSYIDFSDFTYDRESAYGDVTTTVLIEVSDGVWEEQTINVYDSVFSGEAYSSDSGIDGFAQAADDALQVIEYVHEFEVPAG